MFFTTLNKHLQQLTTVLTLKKSFQLITHTQLVYNMYTFLS